MSIARNSLYVFILYCLIFLQSACHQERSIDRVRPNILLINVDDMGWKDPAVMGSRYYETPNIDKLAAKGIILSNAYASAANCAPSRACLMSGQYTPRHGIYTVGNSDRGRSSDRKIVPTPNNTTLPDSILTLAEILQSNGYRTIHAGKWHLGADPCSQGFDVNIGGAHYGHPPGGYFSPYKNTALSDGEPGEYLTDRITTDVMEVLGSLEEHQPFFLNFSPYAVHTPIQPKPEKVPHFQDKPGTADHHNAQYAAMIASLDENIGRLLQHLESVNKNTSTFILFTTDNGGVFKITRQHPLRAGKGSYYEGGIRVPTFAVWKDRIAPGGRLDYPVSNIDFYPTCLEVAGVEQPFEKVLDGISLVPLLIDGQSLPARALYWHFPIYLQSGNEETGDPLFRTRPGSVVRRGAWKLHEYFEDGHLELYNLETDVGERLNLVASEPDKTAELHSLLTKWRAELGAPVPLDPNPEYRQSTIK
jgi:arylsulfatase A-like enzyme